jgi:hypothetical protein
LQVPHLPADGGNRESPALLVEVPRCANSAATSRGDRCPPFGRSVDWLGKTGRPRWASLDTLVCLFLIAGFGNEIDGRWQLTII